MNTQTDGPYVNTAKLRTLKKKSLKSSNRGPGDTIGGIVIDSSGNISICTSSGGHWLKPPGRVGSSAIRGAGFDFKTNETEIFCALASGHGENIIEQRICGRTVKKLKRDGFIPDVNKFLKYNTEWDLGLISVSYDCQSRKGSVNIIQTSDAFLYGFVSTKAQKSVIQYSQKGEGNKYVQSGF